MTTAMPPEIEVEELARLRAGDPAPALVDVREPWEVGICAIPGSVNLPLTMLAGGAGELPRDRPLVVICHHGIRSLHATGWLRRMGFDNAVNLRGGIDAWARRIDPDMATY